MHKYHVITWIRLLYSQHKLKRAQCLQLKRALQDYTFTCDAPLKDSELPEGLSVDARDIACGEPIEKLYYVLCSKISSNMCLLCKGCIIPGVLTVKVDLKLKKCDVATHYYCTQLSKYVHNSVRM